MEISLQQAQQIKAAVEAKKKAIREDTNKFLRRNRRRFRKKEKNCNICKNKCRRR
jgi:hypothetical protein